MRDDAPNVARFQAIHIGSRSVHFLADVVAGAMHEILGESGFTDDLARGAIDLPTFDGAAGADIFLYVLYGGIACLADNGENLGILFGYLVAKKSSPGNVVVNAVGSEGFGPDVEQQQIAPLYCGRTLRQWLVMRVTRVRADGHDWRRIGEHAARSKLADNPLLQIEFGEGLSGGDAPRRFLKGLLGNSINHAARVAMRIK